MELINLKKSIFIVAFLFMCFFNLKAQRRTVSYLNDDSENHKMDIYPANEASKKGINILAITSGGFIMTDKDDLQERALELSAMGYTVYVPNYSDVMYSEVCKKSHGTWFKPVQEINAALAYLEKSESVSEVYVYGESAGGIVALNLAFLTETSNFHSQLKADFGSKKKLGNHTIKIKGAFTISAGVFDLSIFNQKNNTPLLMIHASCDQMVPYSKGVPLMCNEDAIELIGSNAIFEHIKTIKSVTKVKLITICNANHDITDNNFLAQFQKFISDIESGNTIKLKRELLTITLSKNEMSACDNGHCK